MSKSKNKVPKLTDEQYNAYIMSLRHDASMFNADGSQVVPDEIDVRDKNDKQGD